MPFVDRLITDPLEQITLDEIKNWLKVEHDLDNDLLNQLKEGVVHQAFNFMQNDFVEEVDETGELVNIPIPFDVKTGCLMFIAYLYENRGDQQTTMPLNCMRLFAPYKRLVGT